MLSFLSLRLIIVTVYGIFHLFCPIIIMQRCVECGGSFANCATRPGSVDGSGIADADIVIYVGTSLAGGTCSPTSNVIAFASACQLENTLDR